MSPAASWTLLAALMALGYLWVRWVDSRVPGDLFDVARRQRAMARLEEVLTGDPLPPARGNVAVRAPEGEEEDDEDGGPWEAFGWEPDTIAEAEGRA